MSVSTSTPTIPGEPVVVREIKEKGRGLFATREFKQGESIHKEVPMIYSTGDVPKPYVTHPWALTHAILERTDAKYINDHFGDVSFIQTLPVWDADDDKMMAQFGVDHPDCSANDIKKCYAMVVARNLESHIKVLVKSEKAADTILTLTVGFGFYQRFGFLNHSCEPNVEIQTSNPKTGEKVIYALSAIARDDQLQISYVDSDRLQLSVQERQKIVVETFGFSCICARCIREMELDNKKSLD